jgi:hypothetical protein
MYLKPLNSALEEVLRESNEIYSDTSRSSLRDIDALIN